MLSRRSLLGSAPFAIPFVTGGCDRRRRDRLFAADAQPDGYPTVAGLRAMAESLERRTGGRLKVKVYPGAQLGSEKDTLEITIFGGLDLNRINIAPLNSIVRETVVPALPFLFSSIDHMRRAVDGAPGDAILRALEPRGMIGLCFYDSGARSFYNTRRPVHTPDDLKGLKIRVQNSDLYVALVAALGGNPTPMTYGEVYQGLLQGVIDGAENNWPSYESSRHYEVARHYTLDQHVMAPEVLVMSAHRWRRLSEADREAVMAAARDSVPVMRRLWDARVEESRARVLKSGIDLFESVDRAAFQARMPGVWARFVDTPHLQRLVDDVQSMGNGHA